VVQSLADMSVAAVKRTEDLENMLGDERIYLVVRVDEEHFYPADQVFILRKVER
jgi:thymidine kinase